jgi:hypothetical protein
MEPSFGGLKGCEFRKSSMIWRAGLVIMLLSSVNRAEGLDWQWTSLRVRHASRMRLTC